MKDLSWGYLFRLALAIMLPVMTLFAVWMLAGADYTGFTNLTIVNISGETFGMVVCTLILLSIFKDRLSNLNTYTFMVLLTWVHMLLFWDVMAWLIDGNPALYHQNVFLNHYIYVLAMLVPFTFWEYLRFTYRGAAAVRKTRIPMYVLLAAGLFMVVGNLFTGWYFTIDPETSVYHRSDLYIIASVFPSLMALVCSAVIILCEKRTRRKVVFLAYVLLPLTASVIQTFVYGTALQNMAMIFMLVAMYANIYLERSGDLIRYESDMIEQRAAIMVSQIQPHFLYNALTAIMNIKGNPPATRDAIAEFGHYMRKNLDSLTQVNPIPFSREVDHVESYLLLVGQRYGDRLDVRFDVQDGGFFIPPLTIKVILQEAVKHNLQMTEDERVHMVISAVREGASHVVSILNLEPTEGARRFVSEDGEEIRTMKKRLQTQVGGTLENKTTPEGDLLCLITIPVTKGGA